AWIVERFRLAERLVDGRSTEYLMSEAALAGSRLQSAASRQGTGDDTPTADRPTPLFRRVSDVQEREIEWLWGGRIPWAMPVLLAGDGGVGKSTVAQSIGARLTRGQAMPAGTLDRPRGVLILTTEEDTAAVIRPRMRLMGADLNRVHDLDPDAIQPLKLPSGGELIDGLCAAEDIGLIMVDTGPSFLDEGLSGWRDEGIRAFFAPLNRIAQKHRLAVLVLAHLNKMSGGDSGHRIMGGAAWRNVPRNVLIVAAPPGENPRETRDRVLAVEKSNVAAFPPAIEFQLVSSPEDPTRANIEWGQERPDLHAGDLVRAPADPEERSATDDAAEWLEHTLAAGELTGREIKAAAATEGITDKVLRRARERLKIDVRRHGFGADQTAVWTLPPTRAHQENTDPLTPTRARVEEPDNQAGYKTENDEGAPTHAHSRERARVGENTHGTPNTSALDRRLSEAGEPAKHDAREA
ncbi:MAG TPA: AAA family ATPase, partial [Miltoncostaeaceae bacterium]|nr:AAA family ATPase [Miltoncostaeaceae bacterium]